MRKSISTEITGPFPALYTFPRSSRGDGAVVPRTTRMLGIQDANVMSLEPIQAPSKISD